MIREIGGSTDRFGLSACSVRFGFGAGSSINETVSTGKRGIAGFGFSAGSAFFAAAAVARGGVGLAAADLVLFAFSCDEAFAVVPRDEPAAEGLRAADVLRAAVLLLVVFVGISCF